MRYLPHTSDDIKNMLKVIGIKSLEELYQGLPVDCFRDLPMNLPAPLSEWELDNHMDDLSSQCVASLPTYKNYSGAGSYEHHIPYALNYVCSRSEFVTAYTPYQPEISQGTLQAIFEYQTLVARLFGMEVSNASLYDGASALAEALLMAIRIKKKNTIAISQAVHPHYRQVVQTYFSATGNTIIELPLLETGQTDLSGLLTLKDKDQVAAVAVQSPNFFGCIEDLKTIAEKTHQIEGLFVTCFTEPLAYGLLHSPGNQGADIVCGEGQSFGIPQSFGGPSLGMLACKQAYVRNIPGRLVGQTQDTNGHRGYVLTLATREQHIRREKATSNICTNASFCALSAAMYLSLLGGKGLRKLAQLNYEKSQYLKKCFENKGLNFPFSQTTFNEFVVQFPKNFDKKLSSLHLKNIIPGIKLDQYYHNYPNLRTGLKTGLKNCYLICVTETKTKNDLDILVHEVTQ